jgi:hypothetical protein
MLNLSDWEFDGDRSVAAVVLAGAEQREENGYVLKEILRTGEWPVIPTAAGLIRMPLRIVRDGRSDFTRGLIAMSELVENFNNGAIPNVQIPLADRARDDHIRDGNLARVNTGFVREVWIEDQDDGISKLVAKMEFTEPDVKERALRGTFADVSPGIPWRVFSRGRRYGACLEHVCITNSPFQDGLGPFLALSNTFSEDAEVAYFSSEAVVERLASDANVDITPAVIDAARILEAANEQLSAILGSSFRVESIRAGGFYVANENLNMSWLIPFKVEDSKTVISSVDQWVSQEVREPTERRETEEEIRRDEPVEERRDTADVVSITPISDLDAARQLRQARLGLSGSVSPTEEGHVPLSAEELSQLNLSEIPESQRAVFQKLLNENVTLSAQTREIEADQRIRELEGLGLRDRPGALKLYRQVMLSDDSGPAVVLLSDNGQNERTLTAREILDQFIDAVKGADGKVLLSDQAIASGNDDRPAATPDGERKSLEERLAEAREALQK